MLPVPEWASFLEPTRYEQLRQHLAVAADQWNAVLDLDSGRVLLADGSVRRLPAVAQDLHSLDESLWPEALARYLNPAGITTDLPSDLESLRSLLRVRLYAPDQIGSTPCVKVHLVDGLVICLAVDLPDRVQTLPHGLARTLGVTSEELFDLGMDNVRRFVETENHERRISNGARLISIAGDDFCTASLALALDEFAPPEPTAGFLVGVPNRHEVLAIPIDDRASLNAIPTMLSTIQQLFARGPGSLSPYLYWVRGRKWARVELEESDAGLGIVGPEVFVTVVQELGA